ncbi:MAG: response regulator, partial [Terriglobia bacterium]
MATVLIVEDNASVAKFYALALERRGQMKCVLGRSADEVLSQARSGKVDAILLDVSLANFAYQGRSIDGLELSSLLKNEPDTKQIPILLATAHAMPGDRERFLAASRADDYIQKPVYDPQVRV